MTDSKLVAGTLIAFLAVALAAWASTPTLCATVMLSVVTDARPTDTARETRRHSLVTRLPYGIATDQVDLAWHTYLDIASGASVTINASSGACLDSFGASVAFGHIKVVMLENKGDTVLTVGSGTSPVGFLSGVVTLPAGASVVWLEPAAGWSTTGAGNLRIENDNTGTGSYKITIAGTSL